VPVTREVKQTGWTNVSCGRCRTDLKPVFPNSVVDGVWHDLQADDALALNASGGFGMFVDPMLPSDTATGTFLLCADCAQWLEREVPGLALVLSRMRAL
jgi:hypothetical protein